MGEEAEQEPRGRVEEATQATQGTFDPRRTGENYSTLSASDTTDIICILHPCSPAAYEITSRTAARRPQHVLQLDQEQGVEDDLDWSESDEQSTFVLSSEKPKRTLDIALRMSSRTQNPGLGFLFGRSTNDCDFVLDTDTVRRISNIHFRIFVNDSGVLLLQDVSTNGTLVDDTHLVGKASATPQTRMLLGGTIIQILSSRPEEIIKFVVKIPSRGRAEAQFNSQLRQYVEDMTVARSLPAVQPIARKMAIPPQSSAPRSSIPQKAYKELSMHWDGRPKYNVLGQIGKGAFATVYRIATAAEGHYFAAKELEKRKFMKNGVLDRKLDNEMQIMTGLTHPNIVQFVDYHDHTHHLYIIMEYIPHGDLQQYIGQRGPLPEQLAKSVAIQVFSALHYLHKKKITHRDIKPDNILIADLDPENFWIKLSDFGLSKVVRDEDTFLKTFCGTLLYCAPEVFPHYDNYTAAHGGNKRQRKPGERKVYHSYSQSVDIWSFGAVLWYALCGQTPFEGVMDATGRGMFDRIMGTSLNPYPLMSRGVSAQAIDLLLQMLQTDPSNRPAPADCLRHPWFADMISQTESMNDNMEHGLNSIVEEESEFESPEDPVDLSQLQIQEHQFSADLEDDLFVGSGGIDYLDPRESKRVKLHEQTLPPGITSSRPADDLLFAKITGIETSGHSTHVDTEPRADQVSEHAQWLDIPSFKGQPRPDSFTTGSAGQSLSGADSMVRHLAMDSPQSSHSRLMGRDRPHTPPALLGSMQGHGSSQDTPRQNEVTPKPAPFSRQINLPVTAQFFYDPRDPSTHNPEYASRVSGHDFVTNPSAPASSFNACIQTSMLAAQAFPERTQKATQGLVAGNPLRQAAELTAGAEHGRTIPALGRLISTPDSFTTIEIPLTQRLTHWGRANNNTHQYPDPTEPRVPRRGLIMYFSAKDFEATERSGGDWTRLPDLHCLIATEATAGIQVNGTRLGPRTTQAKPFGKLYDGDVITVALGKGATAARGGRGTGLKFRVELWCGEGKDKRSQKFAVQDEQ